MRNSIHFSSPLEGERANVVSGGGTIDMVIVGYAPPRLALRARPLPLKGGAGVLYA